MKLTLNIGSGNRTYEHYPTEDYKCINFDGRSDLTKVDEVGDVKDLSRFPDEHFDFILASDIIEHFPLSETETILKEWKRVLKTGQVIEFRLPNLAALCKAYTIGQHDAKLTSWLLYGGQDYPGNFHYVCFDGKWFSSILNKNGFEPFNYVEVGNNFEIKARKL